MLRTIFSTRMVVLLTALLALLVGREGSQRIIAPFMEFQTVLIVILVLTAISIAANAFSSYDISSKRAFVMDIALDMAFVAGAVLVLTYLLTAHYYTDAVDVEAMILSIVAVALAAIDFLISLNGGAGKLLEMDNAYIHRG